MRIYSSDAKKDNLELLLQAYKDFKNSLTENTEFYAFKLQEATRKINYITRLIADIPMKPSSKFKISYLDINRSAELDLFIDICSTAIDTILEYAEYKEDDEGDGIFLIV